MPGDRNGPAVSSHRYDVVAIGASAGGLSAIQQVLTPLPHDFPCSIVVVQHMLAGSPSMLARLLGNQSNHKVKQAENGESLIAGLVYVAPPDLHLVIADGHMALDHSLPVHYSRPSIDVLFESVAEHCKQRAVGVLLTGSNTDGAAGIRALHEAGAMTIVQSPKDAQYPVMPAAAIATGCVDVVLPLADIGPYLTKLCCCADRTQRPAARTRRTT